MMAERKTYQDFIAQAYFERRSRNASYSMRAFARDLGMSPSQLSLILNRKRGVSTAKAQELVSLLGLRGTDADLFRTLVSTGARSRFERQRSADRLQSLYSSGASSFIRARLTERELREIMRTVEDYIGRSPTAQNPDAVAQGESLYELSLEFTPVESTTTN